MRTALTGVGACSLIIGSLVSFSSAAGGAAPEADKKAVVKGNTAFALELYAKLKEQQGNLFLSPFSISTALAMTYAGARGQTAAQMARVLHFELDSQRLHPTFRSLDHELRSGGKERGYELSVANALWAQKGYGFLKQFLDLTRANYGAGLREVDFARATETARRTINAWVEKETRDKIKELLKPGVLKPLTRLVLTNAIYFKGNWASQFDKKRTRNEPFTLLSGKRTQVPMMHQKAKFGYMETSSFHALELPYAGNELSMVVFLPRTVNGLPGFEKSFTAENLATSLSGLRRREVIVAMPRFKTTSEFALASVLKSMGMTDALSMPPADFSGMNGRRDLFIQAVVHKAYVDVNEEGTEAAAATGVVVGITSVRRRLVFRADHPFLFLIRDKRSGSILFLGRVVDPRE